MTNEQILKKAIEKAVKNGYPMPTVRMKLLEAAPFDVVLIYHIIFSHSFAKAFWKVETYEGLWQYHLQQMVLEENPLDYISKFL